MSLDDEDKQWIREQLERVETTLGDWRRSPDALSGRQASARFCNSSTEFHKWASPLEARQRTHSVALRALDLEMEQMDDRVKKLEGK